MGRYFNLVPAEGYVAHYETLDPALQVKAEAEADRVVTLELRDFDRTAWRGATTDSPAHESTSPIEVDRAAELIASAEYVILQAAKDNPTAEVPGLSMRLKEEAMDLLKAVRQSGTVTMPNDLEQESDPDAATVAGQDFHIPVQR